MTIFTTNKKELSTPTNSKETRQGDEVLAKLKSIPGEHAVAVGLSGGVDSSLTAALLVEAGWDVKGITLWLMSGKGSCCSEGLVDAASICNQLGIDHHIVDTRETFQKEIIESLVSGYKEGITPSPCSRCNRFVKFSPILHWAKTNLGLNRIATGHYARIRHCDPQKEKGSPQKKSKKRHLLLRGLDPNKDQSYFLYDLSQEILAKVIFPLGELKKSDTRKEASRLELKTAKKPESQDLCLVEHHGSMKAFLDNYLPPREGKIILETGKEIGVHDGIEHFTIGQRKGLGVAWEEPLYVIEIQASTNRVIVAPRSKASKQKCTVGVINWVSIEPPTKPIKVEVQLRYRSNPVIANLTPINASEKDIKANRPFRCKLDFDSEQFSITPGQAAVFYDGEILLGGGIIESSEN
ncbi:tRNA 2-thiouridine(34) synthase MnmA [Prochlorococcus marinus]|uniref:tRNA 2-thiouridine(34) synthase MnmA n=1 Tax=Prochlorococcus marinus TaxID=1219 RepID=UPI0022B4E1D6|nr:tRNA 2-thiouridine(34) synthase MnmA [Prochlorococcus marinus]